jgi:hypothetical protein
MDVKKNGSHARRDSIRGSGSGAVEGSEESHLPGLAAAVREECLTETGGRA